MYTREPVILNCRDLCQASCHCRVCTHNFNEFLTSCVLLREVLMQSFHWGCTVRRTAQTLLLILVLELLLYNKMYREVKDENHTDHLSYVLSKYICHPYMKNSLQFFSIVSGEKIKFIFITIGCHATTCFLKILRAKSSYSKSAINNGGNDKTYTYLSKYSNTAAMCLQVPDNPALHEHFISM